MGLQHSCGREEGVGLTVRQAEGLDWNACPLKKADFFAECGHGLLWELVLRLRTQVYSPGEYVCRNGDVGREMYMVSSGKLEVLAEEDGGFYVHLSMANPLVRSVFLIWDITTDVVLPLYGLWATRYCYA